MLLTTFILRYKLVADFRRRFSKRYPGIDIVVFDGIGFPASGNYLMKNLRATYGFSWIQNTMVMYHEVFSDQKKQIRALKKALRESAAAGEDDEDDFDPYAELGVRPDSLDDEVKQAYKKLMSLFHPDKFSDRDPLVIEFLNEKAQQLNRAKDEIKLQRAGTESA